MAQGPKMNNLGVPGGGRNNFFLYWLAQQGKQAQNNPARGAAPMTKAQWKNMEEFERVRSELRDNEAANLAYNNDELNKRDYTYKMAQSGFEGDVQKDMFSHGAQVTGDTFERLNPGLAAQNQLDADRINALREQEAAARQAQNQAQADATESPFDSAATVTQAQDEAAESGDAQAAGAPGAPATGAAAAAAGVQAPLDRSSTPYTRQTITPNMSASLQNGISGKLFTTASDAELTADKQGRTGRGGPAEVGGPKGKEKGGKPKEEPVKGKEGGKAAEGEQVDPLQAALNQVRVPITPGVDAGGGQRRIRTRELNEDQRKQLEQEFPNYLAAQDAKDISPEEYPDVVKAMASNAFASLTPEHVKGLSTSQRKKLDDWVVRPVDRGGPAEPEAKPEEEPTPEPGPVKEKPKGGGRKKKETPAGGPTVQDGPAKQEEPAKPETPPASTDTGNPPPMGFGDLGNY